MQAVIFVVRMHFAARLNCSFKCTVLLVVVTIIYNWGHLSPTNLLFWSNIQEIILEALKYIYKNLNSIFLS